MIVNKGLTRGIITRENKGGVSMIMNKGLTRGWSLTIENKGLNHNRQQGGRSHDRAEYRDIQ